MKQQQNNSINAWALQVALSVTLLSMSAVLLAASFNSTTGQANKAPKGDANTATPIKHVIVIVGENRSFDHLFAQIALLEKLLEVGRSLYFIAMGKFGRPHAHLYEVCYQLDITNG